MLGSHGVHRLFFGQNENQDVAPQHKELPNTGEVQVGLVVVEGVAGDRNDYGKELLKTSQVKRECLL